MSKTKQILKGKENFEEVNGTTWVSLFFSGFWSEVRPEPASCRAMKSQGKDVIKMVWRTRGQRQLCSYHWYWKVKREIPERRKPEKGNPKFCVETLQISGWHLNCTKAGNTQASQVRLKEVNGIWTTIHSRDKSSQTKCHLVQKNKLFGGVHWNPQ